MAVDSDDNDEEHVHVPRTPKNLGSRKSLPSVESALDDFIVRAKQQPLDVAEFSSENREEALREEVATLKQKLANAEARAGALDAANQVAPTGRPWGAIAGAFALGCACMFGVNLAMKNDARPVATPEQAVPLEPLATQPPSTATPQVTPIEPTRPAVAEPTAPPAPPTPPPEPDKPAVAEAKPTKPTQTVKPARSTTAPDDKPVPTPPTTSPPKTADKPPATGQGSDGLYNPF